MLWWWSDDGCKRCGSQDVRAYTSATDNSITILICEDCGLTVYRSNDRSPLRRWLWKVQWHLERIWKDYV